MTLKKINPVHKLPNHHHPDNIAPKIPHFQWILMPKSRQMFHLFQSQSKSSQTKILQIMIIKAVLWMNVKIKHEKGKKKG